MNAERDRVSEWWCSSNQRSQLIGALISSLILNIIIKIINSSAFISIVQAKGFLLPSEAIMQLKIGCMIRRTDEPVWSFDIIYYLVNHRCLRKYPIRLINSWMIQKQSMLLLLLPIFLSIAMTPLLNLFSLKTCPTPMKTKNLLTMLNYKSPNITPSSEEIASSEKCLLKSIPFRPCLRIKNSSNQIGERKSQPSRRQESRDNARSQSTREGEIAVPQATKERSGSMRNKSELASESNTTKHQRREDRRSTRESHASAREHHATRQNASAMPKDQHAESAVGVLLALIAPKRLRKCRRIPSRSK